MHKHDHCNHPNVKYCTHCNVVYCTVCGKEWGNSWYQTNPWIQQPTYIRSPYRYDTVTSKIDNTMLQATGTCKHEVTNG
jgi:hypothetical protein